MTLRVALVGAGAMAGIVARDVYPGLAPDVRVVAVVDHDLSRAAALAGPLGASSHTSLAEAVVATTPDAVDVRVPHAAHAAVVLEALEAGLHVLVEKPVTTSLADAERLLVAARRAGRVVAVAENYPHLLAVRAAAAAIAAGEIGDLLTVRTTRSFVLDGVWAQTTWRRDDGAEAGILLDQGTHHTSLLRALGGEVASVAARRGRASGSSEVVALTLELASGLVAQALYCWGSPLGLPPVDTEALVLGTAGRIEIDVAYDTPDGVARLGLAGEDRVLSPAECYYDSHRSIVLDWAAAIASGGAPLVGLGSATADVRVVLAARRSLEQGGEAVAADDVG